MAAETSGAMNCSSTKEGLVLPSLPHAVMQLLEASLDEDVPISRLSALAGADPSLAAQILRLANSPVYSGGIQVSSISGALIKMGIKAVQCLAITVSIHSSFGEKGKAAENFSMAEFWMHSILTAICAKFLALKTGFDEPDDAFLAGLLHDIGQLVLLDCVSSNEQNRHISAGVHNPRTGRTLLHVEKSVFGMDHATVGAELMESWRLDSMLVDAVRYHHADEDEIRDSMELVKIVHVADRLAHWLSSAQLFQEEEVEECRHIAELFLELSPDVLDELTDSYREQLGTIASVMGVDIPDPEPLPVVKKLRSDEACEQNRLKRQAFDHAVITGCISKMAGASDPEGLFDALLQGISLFLDPETVFFATIEKRRRLRGQAARGMPNAHRAHLVNINVKADSIWLHSIDKNIPVHWDEFFRNREPAAMDMQVRNFMQGPFLVVPVRADDDNSSVLVIGLTIDRWLISQEVSNILMLLARQFAIVARAIHYRKLYDRERKINAAVLAAIPLPLLVVNIAGKVLFANPAAGRLLGLAPAKCRNIPDIGELPIFEEMPQDFLKDVEKTGSAGPVTLKVRGKDGISWLRMSGFHLTDQAEASGIVLVLEDITSSYLLDMERKKRSELLQKELDERTRELSVAYNRLVQAERLEGIAEFARQVAHEVNNPLGIIKNFIAILRREVKAGNVDNDILEAIDGEIDRASRILEELRHFAKHGEHDNRESEAGASGSVVRAIRAVDGLLGKILEETGIRLVVDLQKDMPCVNMSEDEIIQVVLNLVKNAREALGKSGEIAVRAFVREVEGRWNVIIEVADNGPGIPDSVKERIFEPFVSSKGKENSGLGLSVCYGLVKRAGGRLEVKSENGQGCTFRVTIPAVEENNS